MNFFLFSPELIKIKEKTKTVQNQKKKQLSWKKTFLNHILSLSENLNPE